MLDANDLEIDTSRIFVNRKFPRAENKTESDRNETSSDLKARPKRSIDSTSDDSNATTKTSDEIEVDDDVSTIKTEYEFLELTTGIEAIVQESEENTNTMAETMTSTTTTVSTTTESILESVSSKDDVKKDLYTDILIRSVTVDKKRGKVIIKLGLRLLIGLEYILRVRFSGRIKSHGHGLIHSKYDDDR